MEMKMVSKHKLHDLAQTILYYSPEEEEQADEGDNGEESHCGGEKTDHLGIGIYICWKALGHSAPLRAKARAEH